MRALRFLPLVFLLGVHGFVLFAPYSVLILVTEYALRRYRSRQQFIPIPVQS
jgi:hypothetical protein